MGHGVWNDRACLSQANARQRSRQKDGYRSVLRATALYLSFSRLDPSFEKPTVTAQSLMNVERLAAFHSCFGGHDDEINHVNFDFEFLGEETMRRTTIERGGVMQHSSEMTAIRRA
jgi:hypothetical protein